MYYYEFNTIHSSKYYITPSIALFPFIDQSLF